MKSVVTPFHRAQEKEIPASSEDCIRTINSSGADDAQLLVQSLREAGLQNDQQAIWTTYPNLHHATLELVRLYSISWPTAEPEGDSAVVKAVKTAMEMVSEGVKNGETDRAHVVANYLSGLVSIATDIVAVHAWGFVRNRPVERLHEFGAGFREWATSGAFTEVRFLAQDSVTKVEVDGTRMKLLCAIANTKDVGLYSRFS
ncbi:hypothetical protein Y695_00095 [Hydrogenophaga sp. T4]|nr:hypothetical protein Y695_00095 [Hydrogenophaga sp. T4]